MFGGVSFMKNRLSCRFKIGALSGCSIVGGVRNGGGGLT